MKDTVTNISELSEINGFIGACLVDAESGMMFASEGGGGRLDLEIAGAGNTEVVRSKNAVMKQLGLDDKIEDILITLGTQYHLIRPLASNPMVFIYVALDKKVANLAMARMQVKKVEQTLQM
ncbi:MAG: roadblock/LC7 domain-containing protein [Pseudomonadota bacterium]